MYIHLKKLSPRARDYFSLNQLREEPITSLSPYTSGSLNPKRDCEPAVVIVQNCMDRFTDRSASDSWLGPRLHAAIRLHRSEAADMAVWDYLTLAIPEMRDYVVWRWGQEDGSVHSDRVFGMRRHALARLWWTAELMRNGPDYGPAAAALENQDMIDQYMVLNYFHNRPAALAFVRVMNSLDEDMKGRRQVIRDLSKAFNHILTTYVLDADASDPGPDPQAYTSWLEQDVRETDLIADEPEGPMEPPADEAAVEAVASVLRKQLERLLASSGS